MRSRERMLTAALDNMILSYLVQVMTPGYRPGSDARLDPERVAAFRLFLWSSLVVGPTAIRQSQQTPDPAHRERLDRLVGINLGEFNIEDHKRAELADRTLMLMEHHGDKRDCEILAEAEVTQGIAAVLTFDRAMRKRLGPVARIAVLEPTQWWKKLGIPRGAAPNFEPHASNWLSRETFWRWDACENF